MRGTCPMKEAELFDEYHNYYTRTNSCSSVISTLNKHNDVLLYLSNSVTRTPTESQMEKGRVNSRS